MDLPSEIDNLIDADSAVEVHIGESKSRVFRVANKEGRPHFLKISDSAYVAQEIAQEIEVLDWLAQCGISAPRPVAFVRQSSGAFFLMTEVRGKSMAESISELSPKECMHLGASFLKKIHSLDIAKCPFDRRLGITRKLALENLENGLVDVEDFDPENDGKSAKQLYQEISQDIDEDVVFTHGDYCFPNIICLQGQINGVVDLGRAGIADRYQDIALFLRSFKFNIGDPDISLFLKSYGLIGSVDETKLSFYKKLDEFF